MRLYIVRHGESTGNLAGTLQGSRVDEPLSPRGVQQAEALAARLAGEPIDAVFASPMIRARQTAEILAAPHGLAIALDPDLVEFDWGVWCGRPLNEALEKEVAAIRARWRAGELDASPDGGESPPACSPGRPLSRAPAKEPLDGVARRRARALQPDPDGHPAPAPAVADGRDPPAERLGLHLRLERPGRRHAGPSRRRLPPPRGAPVPGRRQRLAEIARSRAGVRARAGFGRVDARAPDRLRGDPGDEDGGDDGGDAEADLDPLPERCRFARHVAERGAEVDVGERAGEHRDPAREEIGRELHGRQAEEVVDDREGKDGGEPDEGDDPRPFLPDRAVQSRNVAFPSAIFWTRCRNAPRARRNASVAAVIEETETRTVPVTTP